MGGSGPLTLDLLDRRTLIPVPVLDKVSMNPPMNIRINPMDKSFLKLGILDSMIYFSIEIDGLEENNISYFQLMVHYNDTIESGLLGLDCITS
jgi:hypothetical protein